MKAGKQSRILPLMMSATVLLPGAESLAQSTCAHADGTWDDSFPPRQFDLSQSSDGKITGVFLNDHCKVHQWPVAGTFQENGSFTITAANPSVGEDVCLARWFRQSGTIKKPGCHTGAGTWVNSLFQFGGWSWSKPCDVPNSESTASNGWGSGSLATVHKWRQTLSGPGLNFGGRTVTERDPGGGGPDTCWFPGSAVMPFEAITGGSWNVNTSNKWGNDSIGWSTGAVTYYRSQGRAPCGTSFRQRMVIDCATNTPGYATPTLAVTDRKSVV